MQDIVEYLEEKKHVNEERAEKLSEKEKSIRNVIKNNECNGCIDLNAREQLNGVVNKQNELLAVADFIIELQDKYFN